MKKWLVNDNTASAQELSKQLKLPLITTKLLINRGIIDPRQMEIFLNPKLSGLRDPYEIPDIEKAARRVLLAKERGEKVIVYGDYDVDGITGTAILVHTLRYLGIEAKYYIPHRYNEGYGLSEEAIKNIAQEGINLIITVDCGVANREEIGIANSLGLEVIVTDHHNLPDQLPEALAIVNPKQLPANHPSRQLSGAGVAFKFAWAILRTAGIKESGFLISLLDLAALGTLSDMVPLTGENRIIAVGGLGLINERKRSGIKMLTEAASLKGKITENQVYFGLAPRINAAGRLEHAARSVELFLSDDPDRTREIARELSRINSRRQDIGASIKEEIFSLLSPGDHEEKKIIILSGNDWHPGVIGIVASQIVDVFNRPAILIGINEGVGRGSARSLEGINVFELLYPCRDLFIDFGGHAGAAGFEISPEDIEELEKRLLREAEKRITSEELSPKIDIDAEIIPSNITLGLVEELECLAPFGEGNPAPLFMMRGLSLVDLKRVGAEGKHLKMWWEKEGTKLEVIGFGLGKKRDQLDPDKKYDIVFNLGRREYNGFESVQLTLVEYREESQ